MLEALKYYFARHSTRVLQHVSRSSCSVEMYYKFESPLLAASACKYTIL